MAITLLIAAVIRLASGMDWTYAVAAMFVWFCFALLLTLYRAYFLLFMPVFVLGAELFAALNRSGLLWEPPQESRFLITLAAGFALGLLFARSFTILSRKFRLHVWGKGYILIPHKRLNFVPHGTDPKDFLFDLLVPKEEIAPWSYNVIHREFDPDDPFKYTDTMETKGPGGPTARLHWRYEFRGPHALFMEGMHEGETVDRIGITVAFSIADHPKGIAIETEITMAGPSYINAVMIQLGNSGRQGPERIAALLQERHDRSLMGVLTRDYQRYRARKARSSKRRSAE